jgi:hypothetical protein
MSASVNPHLRIAVIIVGGVAAVLLITAIVFPVLYVQQRNSNDKPPSACAQATAPDDCTSAQASKTEIKGFLKTSSSLSGKLSLKTAVVSSTGKLVPELDTPSILLTSTNTGNEVNFTLIRDTLPSPPVSSNVMEQHGYYDTSMVDFFVVGRIQGTPGYGVMGIIFGDQTVQWNGSASSEQPLFQNETFTGTQLAQPNTMLTINTMLYSTKKEPMCFWTYQNNNIVVYKSSDVIGSDWAAINVPTTQSIWSLPYVVQTADFVTSGICVLQGDSRRTANLKMYVSTDNFITVDIINVFLLYDVESVSHFANPTVVLSSGEVRIVVPTATTTSLTMYWAKSLAGTYSIKQTITVPTLTQASIHMGLFENDVMAIFGQSFDGGPNYLMTSDDNFVTPIDNIFTIAVAALTQLQVYFVFLAGGERRIYLSTQNYTAMAVQGARGQPWVETEICKTGKHTAICVQQYSPTEPCALVALQPQNSPPSVQTLGSLTSHVVEAATVTAA